MRILSYIITVLLSINVFAEDIRFRKENVKIVNPGEPLNSAGVDYAPFVTSDGKMLFFVSNRPGSHKHPDGDLSHDFYIAIKRYADSNDFVSVFNIDPPGSAYSGFNTSANEGAGCISSDSKLIYYTVCDRQVTYGSCDIYCVFLSIEQNRITIHEVFNLGGQLNSPHWDSQPSISPDNKRLYFSSTRYTGKAQSDAMDLYYSEWDTVNSIWGKPIRIDELSTTESECMPFICADNKTLIFSSDGFDPNHGKLDLYYSVLDTNGKWSVPVNMGDYINTDKDDCLFTVVPSGNLGYFSSNRVDIPGAMGKLDIYMVTMPPLYDEIRTIAWQQGLEANGSIDIYDSEGKSVNMIEIPKQGAGRYSIEWDGIGKNGEPLPAGKYYYEVTIGDNMPEPPRLLITK